MADKPDSSVKDTPLPKSDATHGATAAFQGEVISASKIGSRATAAAAPTDGASPQGTGKDLAHDVDFNAHPDIFMTRQPQTRGLVIGKSETHGLGTENSKIETRGLGGTTDAPPENDLRKTAADAQARLDQMNPDLKKNLTPDQSAKLRKLESSVLSGDLKGVQSALDSMRPTEEQDPAKATADNAAIMSAFSADMKAAGISANFDGDARQDEGFIGSSTPNQSLQLSDHFPENFDQFYNHSFTDLNMSNASGHTSFADQSIPYGPTTTPGSDPLLASQALNHLGELAQHNLGVLPPPSASQQNPQP
jgi:hypothetical protein